MRVRNAFILPALLILCVVCACASHETVYWTAGPDKEISLPRDHYAHPDYRTEWWYYTGNLADEKGRTYGYELVFFKRRTEGDKKYGIPGPLVSNPAHLAHFALTDETGGRFFYDERLAKDYRIKNGRGGAREDVFLVWNGDWSARELDGQHLVQAKMENAEISLLLKPLKAPVVHGSDGYFVKSEGKDHSAYYISYTRMETRGMLILDGKPLRVSGLSWMDHEYGSRQMSPDQIGWDWFSIQLDNNVELMLYLFRSEDGEYGPHSGGTLVLEDGQRIHIGISDVNLEKLAYWKSEQSGAEYPVQWRISIPRFGIDLSAQATVLDQELQTPKTTETIYWEGSILVEGSYWDAPVAGFGYLEMCGYAEKMSFLSRMEEDSRSAKAGEAGS